MALTLPTRHSPFPGPLTHPLFSHYSDLRLSFFLSFYLSIISVSGQCSDHRGQQFSLFLSLPRSNSPFNKRQKKKNPENLDKMEA